MPYGFEQSAARAKAEIDDALGQRMRQMQQPMQNFQEGGLATSVHTPQDFHERDIDFINTRNQHMRELVGKAAYAEGGAVSTSGGQAVTSIPLPSTTFTPVSVPKPAAPQPQYGPLMQSLMAKQAAAKPVMPQPAMPQLAVQKPPMPMPPAPTDAGPMRSDAGIPLWMQLAPGPQRDAAYAQFMNAQSGPQPAPAMPQPAAPTNAGPMPAWTQYMNDISGPQPAASGPAANSLPLGMGFDVTLPKVTSDMLPSAPTMPQPAMPQVAMPQVAPGVNSGATVAKPQYGPLMQKLMARQAAAKPQYGPMLSRLLSQYR